MAFEESSKHVDADLHLPESLFGLVGVDKLGFERHECHVSCEAGRHFLWDFDAFKFCLSEFDAFKFCLSDFDAFKFCFSDVDAFKLCQRK